jgi:hypothetical protein
MLWATTAFGLYRHATFTSCWHVPRWRLSITELLSITRQRLVELMVQIVARTIGPEFDFVLVVRQGDQRSYVLNDVEPERARSMLVDALHHHDMPGE